MNCPIRFGESAWSAIEMGTAIVWTDRRARRRGIEADLIL